jgi:hypothetical protein
MIIVRGDLQMAEESALRSYKLSLMGSGITIDREIDQATALAVLQLVLGGQQSRLVVDSDAASGVERAVARSGQRLSLREVLEDSGAKTIPSKIVTIGSFLRDHEGQATFSREDNKARFKTAGEPAPANYPRDFSKALRSGWVAEDHQSPGQFYVTRRGDEAVAGRFEGNLPIGPKGVRRRRSIRASGHDAGNSSFEGDGGDDE